MSSVQYLSIKYSGRLAEAGIDPSVGSVGDSYDGALLKAEIADKTARSIKYQMASAKLPAARELAEFDFAASPVNEPLIAEA